MPFVQNYCGTSEFQIPKSLLDGCKIFSTTLLVFFSYPKYIPIRSSCWGNWNFSMYHSRVVICKLFVLHLAVNLLHALQKSRDLFGSVLCGIPRQIAFPSTKHLMNIFCFFPRPKFGLNKPHSPWIPLVFKSELF